MTRAEAAADVAMAAAARAAAAGTATSEQRRGLEAMNQVRTHEERRRVWMDLADGDRGNGPGGGRPSGHSAVA